jgi:multidrug efflux pump subunit AcrB
MKITNTAITYRTSVLVLTAIVIFGGLASYTSIPKESYPSIEIPYIVVTTIYPGASPDDIESLLTQPIEQEVQSINGIKEIRSTSTEGISSIVVEFDPQVSIDDAFQKVRDKVDIAKPDLPDDAEEPMVNEIDLTQFPIMTINLTADYSLARLKEVAENLADELETISSVLQVDIFGGLDREVQINVDLGALQGYNLSFDDIVETVREENSNIPGGSIDVDRLNYLVRVDGEFTNPREIEHLVITAESGTPVYVRDVASIDFGFKDRASYSRLQVIQVEDDNDRLTRLSDEDAATLPVISLNVKKRSGENILDTANDIEEKLADFKLPPGTRVEITGDLSEGVRSMVKDLENNIISGLIFVVAVLLFFLGMRNAFLVGIAIPLSMFISFLVFQALGYTLNFVILFSLIIALGMLVDNAVVIVENIYRFREEGYSRFQAAKLGTAEVAGPVLASTATTVAAFAPMLFWPGITGEFMSYLPLTLIVTLSSSLFVALIINPVLTGIFVKIDGEEQPQLPRFVKIVSVATILLLGAVLGFANWRALIVLGAAWLALHYLHAWVFRPVSERFVRTGLPKLIGRYRSFLRWMLERDYTVRRALLRNTLALGLFTVGFLMSIVGGLVMATAGVGAGAVLLVPGGLALVLGIVGIFVHAAESVFLGRSKSVRAGLVFAVITVGILGLMSLGEKDLDLATVVDLLMLPAGLILVGFLGVLFGRRERLILTDNRARLLTLALAGLFAIFFGFVVASPGTEFFPDTDPNMIQVNIEAPLGTHIEESNRIADEAHRRIQNLLAEREESKWNLKNVLVGVGVGGDAFFGGGSASPDRSSLTMNMVDYADRDEPSRQTMERLREQLKGIPGVQIEFTKDSPGPPTGAPVNIEISGERFERIVAVTNAIRQSLLEASENGDIPGLVDVADNLDQGRPEMQVVIDRERAARFGLSTSQIAFTIRSAINGVEAGKYRDGEEEYDITVRLAEVDRSSLESLKNLTILNEGQQIPLVAVADFNVRGGVGSVTRLDLNRVSTVTADVMPGYNAKEVLAQVQQRLEPLVASLPAGYSVSYTGESEEQDEAFSFLTTALMIAVALIFMIMVAQFNRVSLPFIIMVAVGLSLIGVVLGLILTRTPFGLIPLTFGLGIDFIGLITEFRPNFQFGSESTQFWGPMGTSIIAGLTFATFLTLVIVPVMYSAFDSLASRVRHAFGKNGIDLSGATDGHEPAPESFPAAGRIPVSHATGQSTVPSPA